MRDEETGTWWQQVSGEAILGPLKGQRLKSVFHDEISFGLWKRERPQGRVLKPDERIAAARHYEAADWETRMSRAPVVKGVDVDHRLAPRTLVIGITTDQIARAYPFSALQKQNPIIDVLGHTAIMILLGEDNRSVRAFERTVDGRELEFFARTPDGKGSESGSQSELQGFQLIDKETGSNWSFEGTAVAGPLLGHQLRKVVVLEDYWFDWRIYHPDTSVYQIGPQ